MTSRDFKDEFPSIIKWKETDSGMYTHLWNNNGYSCDWLYEGWLENADLVSIDAVRECTIDKQRLREAIETVLDTLDEAVLSHSEETSDEAYREGVRAAVEILEAELQLEGEG